MTHCSRSNTSRPWLLEFATRARGRVPTERLPYDERQQVTMVTDEAGATVPAARRQRPPQTKKGDIEKQEDQKDRW